MKMSQLPTVSDKSLSRQAALRISSVTLALRHLLKTQKGALPDGPRQTHD